MNTGRGDQRTAVTVAAEDVALAEAAARCAVGVVTTITTVYRRPILPHVRGHSTAAVSRCEGCEAYLNQDQRRELHCADLDAQFDESIGNDLCRR